MSLVKYHDTVISRYSYSSGNLGWICNLDAGTASGVSLDFRVIDTIFDDSLQLPSTVVEPVASCREYDNSISRARETTLTRGHEIYSVRLIHLVPLASILE